MRDIHARKFLCANKRRVKLTASAMNKVEGASVKYTEKGHQVEETLFTHSQEEQESHHIASANAAHVFTPEFIPYYARIQKLYKLSLAETLIYGFIRFFTSTSSRKFYFTNEQLSELLDVSVKTISRGIKNLNKKGVIDAKYKRKSDGGQIRFVKPTGQFDQLQKDNLTSCKRTKSLGNDNKINKNKINKDFYKKNVDNSTRPKIKSAEEVIANRHSYLDLKD